jgi:DNA (cytosine-5)-methyltransferase 1
VVMGEQVAGAAGYGWLDGVRADLEAEGYASRGVDIPACAVDAPPHPQPPLLGRKRRG